MFGLLAAGASLASVIGKAFSRKKANKEMGNLMQKDPAYTENPIARQRLGLATTLLNARAPGSAAVERGIYTNQANLLGRLDKTATDASQALAMASGIGGNTNKAFEQLGIDEARDYERRYGNLVNAQQGVIDEQDKVFGDQVRRFGNEVQFKGAQAANRANTWEDIGNFGYALSDFGAAGGFKNIFKRQPQQDPKTITTERLRAAGDLPRLMPRNFRIPK